MAKNFTKCYAENPISSDEQKKGTVELLFRDLLFNLSNVKFNKR